MNARIYMEICASDERRAWDVMETLRDAGYKRIKATRRNGKFYLEAQ